MTEFLIFVGGFVTYMVLDKWSKKDIDEKTRNQYILPRELQLSSVPTRTSQAYLWFYNNNRPWTSSLRSLAQWRFLASMQYDVLTDSIYCVSYVFDQVKTSKQRRIPFSMRQSEYDQFKRKYESFGYNLKEFSRLVDENHRSYCVWMEQKDEKQKGDVKPTKDEKELNETNAGNTKSTGNDEKCENEDMIGMYHRRSDIIKRMNNDVQRLAFWCSKMKQEVDKWFLTIKYCQLYSFEPH